MTKVKTISLPDSVADELDNKANLCDQTVSGYITTMLRLSFGMSVATIVVKTEDIERFKTPNAKKCQFLKTFIKTARNKKGPDLDDYITKSSGWSVEMSGEFMTPEQLKQLLEGVIQDEQR